MWTGVGTQEHIPRERRGTRYIGGPPQKAVPTKVREDPSVPQFDLREISCVEVLGPSSSDGLRMASSAGTLEYFLFVRHAFACSGSRGGIEF
jgi:hypothetical protein